MTTRSEGSALQMSRAMCRSSRGSGEACKGQGIKTFGPVGGGGGGGGGRHTQFAWERGKGWEEKAGGPKRGGGFAAMTGLRLRMHIYYPSQSTATSPPSWIIQISLGDAPRQWRHTRMDSWRERTGVDVVLYQQHLCLCLFVSYGPQGAYIMTSGVHAVSLPAVDDYDHPFVHQRGSLHTHDILLLLLLLDIRLLHASGRVARCCDHDSDPEATPPPLGHPLPLGHPPFLLLLLPLSLLLPLPLTLPLPLSLPLQPLPHSNPYPFPCRT